MVPSSPLGHVPWEWLELLLCRDVYHCRPSELAEEDWNTINLHLKLMEAKSEIDEIKQGA